MNYPVTGVAQPPNVELMLSGIAVVVMSLYWTALTTPATLFRLGNSAFANGITQAIVGKPSWSSCGIVSKFVRFGFPSRVNMPVVVYYFILLGAVILVAAVDTFIPVSKVAARLPVELVKRFGLSALAAPPVLRVLWDEHSCAQTAFTSLLVAIAAVYRPTELGYGLASTARLTSLLCHLGIIPRHSRSWQVRIL